jgi:small acid-soluble spore protein F (minor alpha/beta-type SASP)
MHRAFFYFWAYYLRTSTNTKRRDLIMGRRRRGVMSENLKYEIAKELGFYDTIQREGWGGIKAKDAGNMVKRAIQLAEEQMARQTR